MIHNEVRAPVSFTLLHVDCPGCPGRFELEELLRLEEVHCPDCGKDWRVRTQDVPGRVLVDLLPQKD